VRFETRLGGQLDERLLDRVYELHRDTFLRHGHEPYLTRAFFSEIARTLPESLMVKLALHGRTVVAAAIFFFSAETLFGRYWGAAADYHSLHFETCYHQGIEFCIERRLARFEPGTQGEHKVSRGFEPILTWSAHYIADAQFRAAIANYLAQEGAAVEAYAHEVQAHVPYRGRRSAGPFA
jgi:predicted N-acyltransferase